MSKFDLYQEVTDRIIAEIEKGQIPWQKPWTGSDTGAVNWVNQKPYSLLNQFLLGCGGEWATYKQIEAAGGKVKKGAKASMVVFWKFLIVDKKDAAGNVIYNDEGKPFKEKVPMLRYYNVFNVPADTEGIEPKREAPKDSVSTFDPIEKADAVIDDYVLRSGVKLEYLLQDAAYYNPALDRVVLPKREQFTDVNEFYSTAFHELTHSTGHKSRLNRLTGTAHFGNNDYSKEELVAEIGSASILNFLGIETPKTFKNSAAYIQSWVKALRNNKRMIVSAAGRADKAIKLILNIKETAEDAE